jgi:hypothetical protein
MFISASSMVVAKTNNLNALIGVVVVVKRHTPTSPPLQVDSGDFSKLLHLMYRVMDFASFN